MNINNKFLVLISAFFILVSFQGVAQEKKEISGKITFKNNPVPDVNILIEGTSFGTKTDSQGTYKIKAKKGDVLEYTHVKYQNVEIIIEDVTDEINLVMRTNTNALNEVVVRANTRTQVFESGVLEQAKKKEEPFNTARGTFDPKTAGYSIAYVDGKELTPAALSIGAALNGKVAGVFGSGRPCFSKVYLSRAGLSLIDDGAAIWDVDGFISELDPCVDISNVKDVHIFKSLAGTTRYGTIGRNGVVVLRTWSNTFDIIEKRKKIAEQYTNKTYYNNDAIDVNTDELLSNDYTSTMEAFKNRNKAFTFYTENLKGTIKDFDIHISIAQQFLTVFQDKGKAISILNDLAHMHQNNPEILKAIAYNLQTMDATKDALEIYKNIARLRPNYAQSYRDLANVYKENNEFKMTWRIYMNYLMNRNVDKASAIDQIVYNEMEYLYFNRENQTDIKEKFVPNNESKIKFRNDVRFVVEWNTSEAEFDLEFVGPDKRAYVLEHTLADNQELITNEKLKGFSSDEFFVEDIGTSEWLLNLTYFGNKKSTPTYLKITTYYHWGKPKQRQEIAVYKLEKKDLKMQLKKINRQTLLTFN